MAAEIEEYLLLAREIIFGDLFPDVPFTYVELDVATRRGGEKALFRAYRMSLPRIRQCIFEALLKPYLKLCAEEIASEDMEVITRVYRRVYPPPSIPRERLIAGLL